MCGSATTAPEGTLHLNFYLDFFSLCRVFNSYYAADLGVGRDEGVSELNKVCLFPRSLCDIVNLGRLSSRVAII